MKKIILTIICFICFCSAGKTQNAYYDALQLRKSIKPAPGNKMVFYIFDENDALDTVVVKDILNVLKKYYPELADLSSKDFATRLSSDTSKYFNPFFSDLLVQIKGLGSSSKVSVTKAASVISSLGSLNVTNLADGIARFLIKRGKEELNVAFFNRMKEFLDNPKYPECKTLFPVSAEFLGKIATYRYTELVQTLREAFYKDLSNLLVSLNQLIDLPKYAVLLNNLPEVRAAVRCSKIVSELSQAEEGIMPDSLIHELAIMPELQAVSSNLGNALKLLDIFSQAVRAKPDTSLGKDSALQRWIKLSDLNKLVKDPITLKIFIGLIYQKVSASSIQFTFKKSIQQVDRFMKSNATTIHVISGLIENFSLLANDVDRTIKDFKDKEYNGTLSNDDYYTYITKTINITEYGFKVANIIVDSVITDDFIVVARNANELYKNIYTKNYNNAVMNVYSILDQVFVKLSALFPDSLKKIGPLPETIEKILKYGNFMASVVKAESGEDVENALEAAALPAGSFSLKQKSALNISVNGYIGYAWDFNRVFKDIHARGVYAPVGISISTGSRKKGPTFSGFVSLIDVGGIAAYRLQDSNTDNLKQEVRLESIFSPSAQIFVEPIRGFPLAVGCGWRKTPKLFYSNNTDFITAPPKDVFNLSVLIDIPMFTIINKQFNKK